MMTTDDIFRGEAIAILARTLYGEARGQPREGKVAVACVVLNRVKHGGWYGDDVAECCLWPLQFSCWNDRDPNRRIMLNAEDGLRMGKALTAEFRECMSVAADAVDGLLVDNTHGSTHYINPRVANPPWARGRTPAVVIGDHAFYNDVE